MKICGLKDSPGADSARHASSRFVRALLTRSVFCVLCSLFLVSCGEETPTTPTPVEPVTVTETFDGTINRNGAATHRFTTASRGSLTATLTTLSPDPDLVVGLGVGAWNGSVCNILLARDEAVQTTVIFGDVNAAGELCVRIYDVGRIVDTTDYTITVVHP
jgi:hypothetical protein